MVAFPKRFCAHCYLPLKNPSLGSTKTCDSCEKRLYCSSFCRQQDWDSAAHKVYCGVAGEIGVDYEIRKVNDRVGVGLFALREFSKNDKIMVERPIVVAPNDGSKFAPYGNVPVSAEPALNAMQPYGGTLEEKMTLNAIDVSDKDAGLFLVMAIANHDCIGNADHMYLEDYDVRVMVASRNIRKNEEIRHYYTDPLTPKQQRSKKLRRLYGIHCNCVLCSSPELEKLVCEIYDLNQRLEFCVQMGAIDSAIGKGHKLLSIYNNIGVISTKLEMWVYFEMFQAAIMSKSTVEDGLGFLRKAHQCYVEYTGDNQNSEVKRMEELMESPQKHKDYLRLDRKR